MNRFQLHNNDRAQYNLQRSNYHVPQHGSYHGNFITYKACIHQEIRVHVYPAVQFNLFQGNVLKCLLLVSIKTSYFWKIFLNTWQSASLEILEISLFQVLLWILVWTISCFFKTWVPVILHKLIIFSSHELNEDFLNLKIYYFGCLSFYSCKSCLIQEQ